MLPTFTQRQAPAELIQLAKNQIQDIFSHVKGVEYIMICSTDGFELESVHHRHINNSSKLAAVSSSILAMVSAFLNEIQLIGCQSITLDAENGKAVLTSVPTENYPLVIVTLAAKDVLIGQLLYSLKKAREAISEFDN